MSGRALPKVAPLLFASGACSLVYETVWLRELRLVFGASTMASAAVVACFVGGLGVGGLVFGRRADRAEAPLGMYARLEAGIAASAAATPLLVALVRSVYVAAGGTRTLGSAGGTVLRLLLTAVVFATPTVLMGGTLPAVARAVESDDDPGRRDVALLYAVNTLGAVVGCAASTFVLFEVFGTRLTLWLACLVNALVAVLARSVARSLPAPTPAVRGAGLEPAGDLAQPSSPAWLTLSAAGVSGFVFCLMELVWYRMLAPLLGGSVFTFGLILAIALAGIGLGGLLYSLLPRRGAPTLAGFAWTCVLEAFLVGVPYALGDRVAVLAAILRPVGDLAFGLRVAGWGVIAGLVVLPASLVCGVQFPLLIGLMGRGGRGVGRDVGYVYATNTAGSIAGSLAGGFGLIPLLTAPGCWRFVGLCLLATGVAAIVVHGRRDPRAVVAPFAIALVAWLLFRQEGPTAAWRHSPIGAGRVAAAKLSTPNEVTAWENNRRHAIVWEVDGRESSVALQASNGLAFIVNGKNDGTARFDAGTAIMSGVLGAMLHPNPTRALVIGLGTGETAGWLAAVDSITDVDVDELEPAILEVARRCAALNHDALANPKLHVALGDARELLLTSDRKYSVVLSEPSNPYRAGVASLFTQSYYEAIKGRLEEDGLFLQWMQGYDVDAQTVRTVYATVASVFPEVETWELVNSDLLLVASRKPVVHDVARLRAQLSQEPFRSASGVAWRATDAESFLAHFVANSDLTRVIAAAEGERVNTDDQNFVEFGFAHTVGSGLASFQIEDVRRVARARGEGRPRLLHADGFDWAAVDEARVASKVVEEGGLPALGAQDSPARVHRLAAMEAFDRGDTRAALTEWGAQPDEPRGSLETGFIAFALADAGDDAALAYVDRMRGFDPCEADAVLAHLRLRQGKARAAAAALDAAFQGLRRDPWPIDRFMRSAFADAREVASRDATLAARLYAALREPFVARVFDALREETMFAVSLRTAGPECVEAIASLEPNAPWSEDFLRARYECLRARAPEKAARAELDLRRFLANGPPDFAAGLGP